MPKTHKKHVDAHHGGGGGGGGGSGPSGGGGARDRLLLPRLEEYALNNDYTDIDESVEYMRYASLLTPRWCRMVHLLIKIMILSVLFSLQTHTYCFLIKLNLS
jgi:hypothetical protein